MLRHAICILNCDIVLWGSSRMSLSLDRALGISPAAVAVRSERLELLASNLANADTPGYKARDIDYRRVLADVLSSTRDQPLPLTLTHVRHFPPPVEHSRQRLAPEQLYRVPTQAALDGNTVDPQLEHAAFAENAVQFQASLEFLSRRVAALRSALKAESP